VSLRERLWVRIRALPLPVVLLALENGVVEEVIDDLSGGGALDTLPVG
jgi:hypothetical protein